jgi:hypothetical protein
VTKYEERMWMRDTRHADFAGIEHVGLGIPQRDSRNAFKSQLSIGLSKNTV